MNVVHNILLGHLFPTGNHQWKLYKYVNCQQKCTKYVYMYVMVYIYTLYTYYSYNTVTINILF